MAAKGRGGGKTPEKLVELLNAEIKVKSLRSISRATGLGLAPLSRYLKGESEPSQATLEKMAEYFKKNVAYLRGEQSPIRQLIGKHEVKVFETATDDLINIFERSQFERESLIFVMALIVDKMEHYTINNVAGVEDENEQKLHQCIDRLNSIINENKPVIEISIDEDTNTANVITTFPVYREKE